MLPQPGLCITCAHFNGHSTDCPVLAKERADALVATRFATVEIKLAAVKKVLALITPYIQPLPKHVADEIDAILRDAGTPP